MAAKEERCLVALTNGEWDDQMIVVRSGRLNNYIEDTVEKTDMNQVQIAGEEAADAAAGSAVNLL